MSTKHSYAHGIAVVVRAVLGVLVEEPGIDVEDDLIESEDRELGNRIREVVWAYTGRVPPADYKELDARAKKGEPVLCVQIGEAPTIAKGPYSIAIGPGVIAEAHQIRIDTKWCRHMIDKHL